MGDLSVSKFKLGDCSKRQLLRETASLQIEMSKLSNKMRNVATGFQAMACELRLLDKANKIFDDSEGVVSEEQVKIIDKFLENGEYVQYRDNRRVAYAEQIGSKEIK